MVLKDYSDYIKLTFMQMKKDLNAIKLKEL